MACRWWSFFTAAPKTAAGFDHGTGWSQLANEYGFAVLLPEQTRTNNFNLCFNWYDPGHNRRGAGEPHSIVQKTRFAPPG